MAGTAVSPPRRSARSRTATNGRSSSRATRSSRDEDEQDGHEMDQQVEAEQSEPVTPNSEHASAEITRCICGQQELDLENIDSDESAGLYIQCDRCQVWQHGYCVGIYDASDVPDDYCCELCRPDLHSITVNSNGRKRSSYLPLTEPGYQSEHETTRSSSRSRSSLKTTGKDSASANAAAAHRRRATMNSRDSAYEEILQKVLEESVHDVNAKPDSSSRKRASVSHSEEIETKRLRLGTPPDDVDAGTITNDENKARGRHTSLPIDGSNQSVNSRRNGSRNTRSTGNGSSFPDSKRVKSERFNNDERESLSEPTDTPDRSLHVDTVVGEHSIDSADKIRDEEAQVSIEDNVKKDAEKDESASAGEKGAKLEKSKTSNGPSTPSGSGGGPKSRRPRRGGGAGGTRGTRGNRSGQASPIPGTPISKESGWSANGLEEDSFPPSKPRIPQARTSLGEMRKRIAAILEFIGRTQIDLSMEYEERKILLSSCGEPIPFDFLSGFKSYSGLDSSHDDDDNDNNNNNNTTTTKAEDKSSASTTKDNDNDTNMTSEEATMKDSEETRAMPHKEESKGESEVPSTSSHDKGKDKIKSSYKNLLFEHENLSLELLENLTRKLLSWEQLYGRYGDS